VDAPAPVDPVVVDGFYEKLVRQIKQGYKQLAHRDGLYWRELVDGTQVLAVPDATGLQKQCIQECHDAPYMGHLGVVR
jgi:hypothetical protein